MARNEDKQMEMLLEEGGIADDGMRVDPVSGNEIPPGSMAKEVRDDVPAQLSEGEYVVPADVLRFYGVKFFEDLRAEAKQGLAGMEADGRIGGEPVPMGGPNQGGGDLTPEEMAVLQELGMNVGGMVPQATQSNMGYGQSSPVAMGNVGYAPGGLEDGSNAVDKVDYTQPQSTVESLTTSFGPGFLAQAGMQQQQQPEVEEVRPITMYGPNGEVEVVILPTGQARYEELLNLGYTEEQTSVTTQTSVGQDDGGPDMGLAGQSAPDATPVNELSDDKLASSAKGLGLVGAIGAAVLGPTAGAALQAVSAARYNDILDEMNNRGLDTEGMDRMGSIFGGESGLYEGLADTDGKEGATFGDTWLGDLLGFDGKVGVAENAPGLRESFRGARRTGGDDDTQPTGGGEPQGEGQGDDATANAAGGANASGPSASTAGPSGNAGESEAATGGVGDVGLGSGPGGLNEGGMVKRPKKSKKK